MNKPTEAQAAKIERRIELLRADGKHSEAAKLELEYRDACGLAPETRAQLEQRSEADTYYVDRAYDGTPLSCIDLIYSPDDGGWYAQEYYFASGPAGRSRTSAGIYRSKGNLAAALEASRHRWGAWS